MFFWEGKKTKKCDLERVMGSCRALVRGSGKGSSKGGTKYLRYLDSKAVLYCSGSK